MISRPVLFISILAFFISGCGVTSSYKIKEKKPEEIKIETPKPKLRVGEKFTYKAEWMGMDVGFATLLVEEITELNGREVYHIVAKAETTSFAAKLFPVEDEISTYLDTKELYPVRFDKKQKEGKKQTDEYVDFDQENGKAVCVSRLTNEKKEFNVPKGVQDPVSCIYYFRLSSIKEGESLFANVHLDDKNWFLETQIVNRGIVKIKDLGNYQAFMAQPMSWFQGELNKNAKVSIWFSADEERIPLLIVVKSNIPLVGTVTITLQKIE
ncbi:MAG: DUF3108 domain-containing protein [Candidatus Omnitrophica bacterium]|nr:DUF3108 domain-containing protein [Candidatus Omnitrophota bacterium]